jgi:hypothetical protein
MFRSKARLETLVSSLDFTQDALKDASTYAFSYIAELGISGDGKLSFYASLTTKNCVD